MRAQIKGYMWIVALLAALIFVARVGAASTVFVSQSGGSVSCGADGTQATTALASVTWVAGNTYKICGGLTSRVIVTTAGTASALITIQFETGASIGGAACTSTNPLLTIKSFMLIDLGGNTAAIACPNNGLGLANTNATIGISAGCTAVNGGLGLDAGFNHVEIRNGTIGPIFQTNSTSSSAGAFSHGICLYGGNNNHFHNLTFISAQHGIEYAVGNGVAGGSDEIGHNTFSDIGDAVIYAAGDSNGSTTSSFIHDNDFTVGFNWGNSADSTHIESTHIFTNGANSHFTGVEVYNNFTHGAWPSVGGTACYFFEQGGSTGHNVGGTISAIVHDNICQLPSTGGAPGDGMFFGQSHDMTIAFYNNLVDCGANSHGIAFEGDVTTDVHYTFTNNIVQNCNGAIYTNGTPNATAYAGSNNNIWSNIGGLGWGNVGSFATWKSGCACDAASSTSAPGLNADYTIVNAASLAHTLPGINLTSVGDTTLLTGAPQTFGVTGACGANGCIARPSTGNWDVGPYPLGGTSPAPGVSFSPLSIAFGTINIGASAGPTTVTLTNTGTATLTLSSSVTSTNSVFAIGANGCTTGTNIVAAGTCTFTVTFTPTAAVTSTGNWTVSDNANGSPHTGALSGTGQTGGGGPGCPVGATFCDTFNEGTLDTTKWQVNAFTQPNYAGAGSTVTSQADHCDLTTGVLRSRLDQPTASTSTSCELQSKTAFGYGTYVWSLRASTTSATPTGTGTTASGSISTGFIIDGGTSITEIDSPEIEGQFPNQIEFTNWKNGANTGALLVNAAFNPQDAFHTYGFTWSPGQVQYFIDGVLVGTHTDADVPNGSTPGFILISHYGTNSTGFGGLATVGVTRYQYCNLFAYTPPSAPVTPVPAPAAKLFATTVLTVKPQ